MTKEELRKELAAGRTLDSLFRFTNGKDCEIFKSEVFCAGKEIIYIPDAILNSICIDCSVKEPEEREYIIALCYTGNDFLGLVDYDMKKAIELFNYVDWQHPRSALPEIEKRWEEESGDEQSGASETVYPSFPMGDDDTVKWENGGLRWCLHVQRDRTPPNPRRDFDNIATMICFGSQGLGDQHRFRNPEEFWQKLVRDNVGYDEIWKAAVDGKIVGIRIAESEDESGCYDVYETSEFRTIIGKCEEQEWKEYSGLRSTDVPYYILDDLTVSNCMELLKPYVAWLPLWVYEHSGITMSAGKGNPFTCKWDSGLAGWIVMTKKKAMEDLSEYVLDSRGERIRIEHKHSDGSVTFSYKTRKLTDETWREVAEDVMRCEVATYDQYLTDDIYGYTLYSTDDAGDDPDWDEEDSCWGFFGDDIMENGICDSVGSDLHDAITSGQYERGQAEYRTISYLRL